jgi:hypothetical protein
MAIGGVMIFGGSLRFAERRAIKMEGLVMSADMASRAIGWLRRYSTP